MIKDLKIKMKPVATNMDAVLKMKPEELNNVSLKIECVTTPEITKKIFEFFHANGAPVSKEK